MKKFTLAIAFAITAFSTIYCQRPKFIDSNGDPVNKKFIPIDTSESHGEMALLAGLEQCCCNWPYYYQHIGTPTTQGYFRVFGDSLFIHQSTFTGQNLDSLWMIIDEYKGSTLQFEYTINPLIFGIIEIDYGSGIDMGTWWKFGIDRIESPIPNYANNREHCFSYTVGGFPATGFIPLAGTIPTEPVTGTIQVASSGSTYISPLPDGVELSTQVIGELSRVSVSPNDLKLYSTNSNNQVAVLLRDSLFEIDGDLGFFEGATYKEDYSNEFVPLSLVTKNYVDNAVAGDIPLGGTGVSMPCTGDIEMAGGNGLFSISGTDDCSMVFDPTFISQSVNNSTTSNGTGISLTATGYQVAAASPVANTTSLQSQSGYQINAYNSVSNLDAEVMITPGIVVVSSEDLSTTDITNITLAPGQINATSQDPSYQGINEINDYSANRCQTCLITKDELDTAVTGLMMPDIGALAPTATLTDVINKFNQLRIELQAAGLMAP